jgi:hypothetical protein
MTTINVATQEGIFADTGGTGIVLNWKTNTGDMDPLILNGDEWTSLSQYELPLTVDPDTGFVLKE